MHSLRGVAVVTALVIVASLPVRAAAQIPGAPDPADLPRIRAAAESGDAEAQVILGRMYFDGNGVPQDDVEAVRWFRLAAEQGSQDGQFNLSFMYEYGRGVALDLAEAVHWYRLAAAQGATDAQYNLGRMYFTGQGVEQDYAEAYRWWRMAADSELIARFNLGRMYEAGQGVPIDPVRAYMWLSLATEDSIGEDWIRRLQAQQELGMRLTPGEIAEAETLAGLCRRSGFIACPGSEP